MGALFHEAFVRPTLNALLFFYYIFESIGAPGAFGFAIILLTVLIRLIFHPFFKRQAAMATKMNEIKPHMDKINKKHKDDKKKIQEEQLKLYQKHGVNPAGGCIIALVQLPVFISLYRVIFQFVEVGKNGKGTLKEINEAVYTPALKLSTSSPLDTNFFGLNLTTSPSQFSSIGVFYLAIPLITAILQYYQIKLASPTPPPAKKKKQGKGKKKEDDMQTMMSSQMRLLFPFMIGYFSYTLPLGLSLYWNIFSIFTIIQYKKGSAKRG